MTHPDPTDLVAALEPFDDLAEEMFCRNWNRQDVVIALDNPNEPHRLTFGDFLALHRASSLARCLVLPGSSAGSEPRSTIIRSRVFAALPAEEK